MQTHGFFRTDVTQPFSLGTKCAKTYVTRCLVGDEGTSYKYLGLRMFAHPWSRKRTPTNTNNSIAQSKYTATGRSGNRNNVQDAVTTIFELNDTLTKRTTQHLKTLDTTRQIRQQQNSTTTTTNTPTTVKGRAGFDIALINRMENTSELKREPTMGDGRCSVSWHADSCLENYSTIAVYHAIFNNEQPSNDDDDDGADEDEDDNGVNSKDANHKNTMANRWSIGLRVVHNSEGPTASSGRRTTTNESSSQPTTNASTPTQTPPIAVSLPSGSAYYLLDDFNHHHQHAVLVNDDSNNDTVNDKDNTNSNRTNNKKHTKSSTPPPPPPTITTAGVRYSSTHRLLREGHNVYFVLERCRTACGQFHKKSPKVWRSEQLLLMDVESEWIRQFYIQGLGHKANLWKHWKEPMCNLLKYWGQLETRTKQVLDLLRLASEQRCGASSSSTLPITTTTTKTMIATKTMEHTRHTNTTTATTTTTQVPSRAERKLKDKRKKALLAIEDILTRGDDNHSSGSHTKHTKTNNKTKTTTGGGSDALERLYAPFATLIQERATMRALWKKREGDHVFRTMGAEYRPIPVPFRFNTIQQVGGGVVTNGDGGGGMEEVGISPIDGSPEGLGKISDDLIRLGKAFCSGRAVDLPRRTNSSALGTVRNEEQSDATKAVGKGKEEKRRKKAKFVPNAMTGLKKKKRRF